MRQKTKYVVMPLGGGEEELNKVFEQIKKSKNYKQLRIFYKELVKEGEINDDYSIKNFKNFQNI